MTIFPKKVRAKGLSTNQITHDSGLYHAIWGFPFTTMTRPLFFAKETIIFPDEQKSPMEHAPLDVLLGEFISLFVPALLWSDSVEILAEKKVIVTWPPSSSRKVVWWSKGTLPTPACFRFGEKIYDSLIPDNVWCSHAILSKAFLIHPSQALWWQIPSCFFVQ